MISPSAPNDLAVACPVAWPRQPDGPIASRAHDELARAQQVAQVAQFLAAQPATAPCVLGIEGAWGVGKTSFLNLLADALAQNAHPPLVIRFQPWLYSTVESLVLMFFDELARGIGLARRQQLTQQVATLLRAAGAVMAMVSMGASELLKDAGRALGRQKSLGELKAELDALLPQLDQRIVVLIDDVDRLERDALHTLFKMIRVNANFAGVAYVLAYDYAAVAALDAAAPGGHRYRDPDAPAAEAGEGGAAMADEAGGRAVVAAPHFVASVVNAGVALAPPDTATLERVLIKELRQRLATTWPKADAAAWTPLWQTGFMTPFTSMRVVKQFVNACQLLGATPVFTDTVDIPLFLCSVWLHEFAPEKFAYFTACRSALLVEGATHAAIRDVLWQAAEARGPRAAPHASLAYAQAGVAALWLQRWAVDCGGLAWLPPASVDVDMSEIRLLAQLPHAAARDVLDAMIRGGKAGRLLLRLSQGAASPCLSPAQAMNLIALLTQRAHCVLGDLRAAPMRNGMDAVAPGRGGTEPGPASAVPELPSAVAAALPNAGTTPAFELQATLVDAFIALWVACPGLDAVGALLTTVAEVPLVDAYGLCCAVLARELAWRPAPATTPCTVALRAWAGAWARGATESACSAAAQALRASVMAEEAAPPSAHRVTSGVRVGWCGPGASAGVRTDLALLYSLAAPVDAAALVQAIAAQW